jgi:hypothetical protein
MTKLYRVAVKVRPLPGHPRYWDCQCGFLNVWLFGDSPTAASDAVATIVDALPFERVGTQSAVFEDEDYSEPGDDALLKGYAQRKSLAEESGLSLQLIGVPTGADETGFEEFEL